MCLSLQTYFVHNLEIISPLLIFRTSLVEYMFVPIVLTLRPSELNVEMLETWLNFVCHAKSDV